MYPRTNYEMTEEDYQKLMEACNPVPYMIIGGSGPRSPQENANTAWKVLGEKMGFDHMSVRPVGNKGRRYFTAIPTETAAQKEIRVARKKDEKRRAHIVRVIEKIVDEISKTRLVKKDDPK